MYGRLTAPGSSCEGNELLCGRILHKGISQFCVSSVVFDDTTTEVAATATAASITADVVSADAPQVYPKHDRNTLNILIGVFAAEAGGKPATTTVYRTTYQCCDVSDERISHLESERVGMRTMFAASESKLLWNTPFSSTLLIHTHSGTASYFS